MYFSFNNQLFCLQFFKIVLGEHDIFETIHLPAKIHSSGQFSQSIRLYNVSRYSKRDSARVFDHKQR